MVRGKLNTMSWLYYDQTLFNFNCGAPLKNAATTSAPDTTNTDMLQNRTTSCSPAGLWIRKHLLGEHVRESDQLQRRRVVEVDHKVVASGNGMVPWWGAVKADPRHLWELVLELLHRRAQLIMRPA